MKKLYLIAVTLLLSFTIVLAQEKQEKIGDTPQLNKVSKQVNADQTNGAIKVNSTAAVVTYDFTTGADKYHGGAAAAKDLGGGVWGMIAGDANGDGSIDAVDLNTKWRPANGQSYDYSLTGHSDFNLDASIDAVDRNLYWRLNNGKISQVP